MKLILLCCCLLALTGPLVAQSPATYPSTAAKAHVGEYAHVVGEVADIYITAKGDTFIHFDQPYPASDFSAVIFADDHDKFGDVTHLRSRTITVTGTIRLYHDKAEIVLKRRAQLDAK
jgi:hypothetical protein